MSRNKERSDTESDLEDLPEFFANDDLECYLDKNAPKKNAEKVISYIKSKQFTEAIKLLQKSSVDFAICDQEKNTALHLAVMSRNLALIHQILSCCSAKIADELFKVQNEGGQTPVDLFNRSKLIEALVSEASFLKIVKAELDKQSGKSLQIRCESATTKPDAHPQKKFHEDHPYYYYSQSLSSSADDSDRDCDMTGEAT